jgi:hypothetical protein
MDKVDPTLDINFKMRPYSTDVEKLLKLLSPKKYVIDSYDSKWEKKIVGDIKMDIDCDFGDKKNYSYNAMGMYYKIMCANDLKCQYEMEHGFKYDFVWRARLDYIFLKKIEIPAHIEENMVYLIRDRYATRSKLDTNDKFFGGSSNVMDTMTDIYRQIPIYYKDGVFIEGQTLCEIHIKRNGFGVCFLGDDKTYYKCQGRHELSNINGNVFIDKINTQLMYNVAFYLLHHNYGVFYMEIDTQFSLLNTLAFLKPYKKDNEICNTNKFSSLRSVSDNKLMVNTNIVDVKNNYVDNPWSMYFVLSLIRSETIDRTFYFDDMKSVKLLVGDKIIYLIADKGFVVGSIVEVLSKGRYKIAPKIEGDVVHQSYIIPWDLVSHYSDGLLPVLEF